MNAEHLSIIKKLKMISQDGYLRIYNEVISRKPCNFLIFGVGRDTELWLSVNKGGKNIFLEDSGKWIRTLKKEYSHLGEMDVLKVKYSSDVREASSMLKRYQSGEKNVLHMDLPDIVLKTKWDIILVDGPFGKVPKEGKPSSPGRMKSIYAASELVSAGNDAVVFIHDCEREVESTYCDFFFGKNFELIDGSLRVYNI